MQLLRRFFTMTGLLALFALVGACGSTTSSDTTTSNSSASTAASTTASTPADTTIATTTVPTSPPTTVDTTTTAPIEVQPAIWPAADVVFTTPEAAATDFLAHVFGEGPVLGEFMAGDSRSGEFEVFATADGVIVGEARSVLFMRQLGASDGWFVLAAGSETAGITTPESMATVSAGPLTVAGDASGYEATINISAFVAGDATRLDAQIAMAGNFGEVLPYSVILDIEGAATGDVVVVLVIGTTGLETDPGTFSAIPVVIS